jgi:hypothetical protein
MHDDPSQHLVATAPLPRGTITWVRDPLDRAMSPAEVHALGPLYRAELEKFMFTDGAGQQVLCWDLARYVNHSCEAACLAPGFDFEIAVRDIAAGEQLCDDYAALNIAEPFDCACGAPTCRKIVGPDDRVRLADAWDERLRLAFSQVGRVEQSLWPLVSRRDEIAAVLAGRVPVPSCRMHFATPAAPAAPAPHPSHASSTLPGSPAPLAPVASLTPLPPPPAAEHPQKVIRRRTG